MWFSSEHYKGLTSLQEAWNCPVWIGEYCIEKPNMMKRLGIFYSGYESSIKTFEELGWSTIYWEEPSYPNKDDAKLLAILKQHWSKNWRPSAPIPKLVRRERYIFTEDGEAVTLRGESIGNFKDLSAHAIPYEDSIEDTIPMLDSWNVNILRLGIDLESMLPSEGVWNSACFEALEKVLSLCEQHRIYVMPEIHQFSVSSIFTTKDKIAHGFPPWFVNRQPNITIDEFWRKFMYRLPPYEDGWELVAEAWRRIIDVSNYRNVIAGYDLFNEPPPYPRLPIPPEITRKFYEYLSSITEANDPGKLTFIETPFIRWDIAPLAVSNLVLASHPYDAGYLEARVKEIAAGTAIGGVAGGIVGYASKRKRLVSLAGIALGSLGGALVAYLLGSLTYEHPIGEVTPSAFPCQVCGASIQVSPRDGKVSCLACGSEYEVVKKV